MAHLPVLTVFKTPWHSCFFSLLHRKVIIIDWVVCVWTCTVRAVVNIVATFAKMKRC